MGGGSLCYRGCWLDLVWIRNWSLSPGLGSLFELLVNDASCMDLMRDQQIGPRESVGSFNDFYRIEWRSLVGLAYVLTGDVGVAEDLAQDAFLAASRDWDRVGVMDQPGAWVRRVVANRSVSWFRRQGAERRALARMARPGPGLDLELEAQIQEVWRAVRRLPKRQAQVVALVHFDGMSIVDAGNTIGCGYETARTHLKRGRKTLAAILGVKEGHDA